MKMTQTKTIIEKKPPQQLLKESRHTAKVNVNLVCEGKVKSKEMHVCILKKGEKVLVCKSGRIKSKHKHSFTHKPRGEFLISFAEQRVVAVNRRTLLQGIVIL